MAFVPYIPLYYYGKVDTKYASLTHDDVIIEIGLLIFVMIITFIIINKKG